MAPYHGYQKPTIEYVDRTVTRTPPLYLKPACDAPVDRAAALRTVGTLLDAYLTDASALTACAAQGSAFWLWASAPQ